MFTITRIKGADDPERCEAVNAGAYGQCQNKVIPGTKYCPIHAGPNEMRKIEATSIYRFNVAKYNERVKEFADNPKARAINDEIGVLRMLIEERLNTCHTAVDLTLQSQSISDLLMKLNTLVAQAAKLDLQMGSTLTRAQVENFTLQILRIITKYVSPDVMEAVSTEIQATLGAT